MRHLRPDLASDKCQYIFDQLDGQNSYAFSSPGYCASGIDGSERNTDNNFASMACASLVIFQVMTAANWQLLTDGFFVRIVC